MKISKLMSATEALLTSDNFARRFLISKPLQVVMPLIPLQEFFELPKNAAIHFVAMDSITKAPDPADWFLKGTERKISMQTVTELSSLEGNPTRLTFNVQNEMDVWFRQQRRFRKTRDIASEDPGPEAVVLYNYAQLSKVYRYARSLFTDLYRWRNVWSTVIHKIATTESTRTNLIFLPLPRRLPSMMFMKTLMAKGPTSQLREMPDADTRMIYEIWKWINPATRHESLFAPLTDEKLDKTVIIFHDAGRTMGFNMGTLNRWIIDNRDPESGTNAVAGSDPTEQNLPTKAPVVSNANRIDARQMQMRVLRGFMGLMQQRADAVGVAETDTVADEEAGVRVLTHADDLPPTGSEEGLTERAEAILSKLDEDIAALDKIDAESLVVDEDPTAAGINIHERGENAEVNSFSQVSEQSIDDYLQDTIDRAGENGTLTPVEYMKFNRYMDTAANLPSPYGGDQTAREFAQVAPASTEIREVRQAPDDSVYIDKSMRSLVYQSLDGDYIRDTLKRDMVGVVQDIQRAGMIVTGHSVSTIEDVNSVFESHDIRIQPIEGAASPLRLKVVKINDEGIIKTNGNKYRFRRQRVDLPIRKINDHQVALSSYYPNKSFVNRSDKSAYNYTTWLQRQVALRLVQKDTGFSKVHTGDCFIHTVPAPRAFTAMAQVWRDMHYQDVEMLFNIAHQVDDYGQEAVDFAKENKFTLFGKGTGQREGVLFAMDENNSVYSLKDGDFEFISTFEGFLGIDETSRPMEFTECRIFGKGIPVGVVLGYYYGLSALVKMLGAQVRQVPAGTRANVGPGEWSLVFEDFTLVFSQDDRVASLILSGFNQAAKTIRRYSMFHFDRPAVYFNVIESLGMNGRYVRELDMLRELFVDSITKRVLIKMGEPVTYPELVYRATEMLVNDTYKRPLDPTEQRYRGAERIPGGMYTQLVQAVREQRAKINRSTAKVEMNPYNAYKHTMSDPSLSLVKDINPIHNLKEITSMTYTGHGGRASRSMTRNMRAIDENDTGTLGEASVDNSQVGYNAYLSVAPRFANTEGLILPPEKPGKNYASLLSPAALASPAINSDDGKRIGMASIQHSHTVACVGYVRNPVNTGFERAIAHHTDSSFATTAKMAGKVKSKNHLGIVVEYEDGTTQAIAVGRRFGDAAGMIMPHDMATQYESGDTFEQGAVLVYDSGFFKPALFKKGAVDWMNGTIARVAFPESRETHEDASSISSSFEKRVTTYTTERRDIIVEFGKEVYDLVKVGQEVKYSDSLCVIADKMTAQSTVFTQDRLNTLKHISGKANTAQISGVVDSVEVFYHGMPEDMSDSLREIVETADKDLARRRRAAGETIVTGATDDSMNIGGEPLLMNTVYIRVRITRGVGAGVGNKGVFCHQLKSEISKVYYRRTSLSDGREIDAFYGSKPLFARIVYSAFKVGTAVTVSGLASKKMADIFKGIDK